MHDQSGMNQELIKEISILNKRIKELEILDAERKRAEQEMAILAEIGRVIGSTLDIKKVYEQFASIARKLIPFDSLSVNLIDVPNNIFLIAYNSGLDLPGRTIGYDIPLNGSMTECVMRKRKAMIFNASNVEEITRQYPGITRVLSIQMGFYSNMLIPLFASDAIIGVLHFRAKNHNAYSDAEVGLAERIGMQIGGAMANSRLFKDLSKTEEALREQLHFLQQLLDAIPVPIFYKDRQGIFRGCNIDYEKFVGMTKEHIVGKTAHQVFPKDLADIYHRADGDLFRKSDKQVYETSFLHADGSRHDIVFNKATYVGADGRDAGLVGAILDITERKRAEKELVQSHDLLKNLARLVPGAIYQYRSYPDGRSAFPYSSPGMNDIYEVAPEEVRDDAALVFGRLHPDDHDHVLNSIQESARTLRTFYCEFRVILPRQGLRWRWSQAHPERLMDGSTLWHGIISDISDHKRAEKEKQILEERLQHADKMEAIGILAGGIAHDFNNLLMGIQGYASLMLLDLDPSHPHYEGLKRIEEQVQSGADLAKQLLGFARGGRYEVKPADMNDVLEKSSSMFGRTKKEITIHRKFEKGLWSVEVDLGQMEQVFMNLYVNAWQAMPGGGEIYLETEGVSLNDEQAIPYAITPGKYVKIKVTDTGTGMDAKTKERIFDPFFTTKGMGRGTGLGLAMVYGIIKGHKGMINVYSEPGHGTTFTIYLPASEKEVMKEKTATRTIVRGTETILMVDDEKMVREVSTLMLESLGYQVYAAGSGQEAIAVYMEKQDKIDLIILDMILPGMSGGETFDRLREINPDAKILLSSGYSINGEAKTIMDRGCNGFIQKPFQLVKLSGKIREILD